MSSNVDLATRIYQLNNDVTRVQFCWRGKIFDACALALIDGHYEPGEGALAKLATTFDGWGEIFAELAMKCYDARDACSAAEDAA